MNQKLVAYCEANETPQLEQEPAEEITNGRSVEECEGRLNLIKTFM